MIVRKDANIDSDNIEIIANNLPKPYWCGKCGKLLGVFDKKDILLLRCKCGGRPIDTPKTGTIMY